MRLPLSRFSLPLCAPELHTADEGQGLRAPVRRIADAVYHEQQRDRGEKDIDQGGEQLADNGYQPQEQPRYQ